MESGFKKILCDLFGITARSYSNWAKEDRAVISFFEKGYIAKNEIEEFLESNKIKKFELIKELSVEELEAKLSNIGNYDRDQRVHEIIKFMQLSSPADIANILLLNITKQYDKNSIGIDTRIISKLENLKTNFIFLKYFLEILEDMNKEKNLEYNQMNQIIIDDFNKEVGFDFSINDIPILLYILSRFKVYNTLYEIDEDN
ncbi:MAG: hypothetical protein K8R39_12915 [Arcobacteraceae bacterium]|nr:hypothetical protein [Arcobacteraceae bacterium]